jgi:hypothetical protein
MRCLSVRESKSTGTANLNTERTGNARHLRRHAEALAPNADPAFLIPLPLKPRLVRPTGKLRGKLSTFSK